VKLPARFQVGVATHTGLLRSTNEDDYLLVAPPQGRPFELAAAVADGMGGVTGGAEASRAGLRGLATGLLAGPSDLAAGVAQGFAVAWQRVLEHAAVVPALREMGTTLTAIAFAGGRAVVGHVGDTRAYLLRDGELRQLTTDHALREQSNRLLRCIGGGQAAHDPDLAEVEPRAGDRFLLCSDGIWNTVPAPRLAEVLGRLPAQAAAERLVLLANGAGGPDNGTALVVHVGGAKATGAEHEVPLPVAESTRVAELTLAGGRSRLGAPRWAGLLLLVSVLLLLVALLRWSTGFDLLVWLRSLL
jgi:protein phosphatase